MKSDTKFRNIEKLKFFQKKNYNLQKKKNVFQKLN